MGCLFWWLFFVVVSLFDLVWGFLLLFGFLFVCFWVLVVVIFWFYFKLRITGELNRPGEGFEEQEITSTNSNTFSFVHTK